VPQVVEVVFFARDALKCGESGTNHYASFYQQFPSKHCCLRNLDLVRASHLHTGSVHSVSGSCSIEAQCVITAGVLEHSHIRKPKDSRIEFAYFVISWDDVQAKDDLEIRFNLMREAWR